jgi:lysophospholipase L1-like esterase
VNVLAVGDSIIWGQGNADDSKFVNRVCAWLGTHAPAPTLTTLAHSGAVASPTANDAAPPVWGEVPEAAPSIGAQIDTAVRALDPSSVDVVIVDGGINDVSPYHVVVADPFDPNGLEKLGAVTNQVFAGPVRALIDRTVATFTKARVVVTGYYPIISESTNVRALVQLMKHLPRPTGVANFFDLIAEHLADEMLGIVIEPERRRMIEQSTLFATLSTRLLRSAVAAHAGERRVFFADPGFGPDNAFAAPKTWLWYGADDPLAPERLRRYGEHLLLQPFDWPFVTPLASMCHPNVAGSGAYAAAIEACLS